MELGGTDQKFNLLGDVRPCIAAGMGAAGQTVITMPLLKGWTASTRCLNRCSGEAGQAGAWMQRQGSPSGPSAAAHL